MGCLLDGGQDLRACLGIEFVPVEAKENALPNSACGSCSRKDASTMARAVSRIAQPMMSLASPDRCISSDR
jgi:hypothetical protein